MKCVRIFGIAAEMLLFAIGAIITGWIVFPVLSLFLKGSRRRRVFSGIVHNLWKFFIDVMDATNMVKVNVEGDLTCIKNKIIAASHPSLLDVVFLIGLIPNSLCLAKKGILKNPVMSNIVKSLYIINDVEPEIFKKSAKEALDEGYNIVIFPTGTRTLPDEKPKIHKGAALLAIDNNTNIVPIKISVDFPFLAKNTSPFNVSDKKVHYILKVMPEINPDDYNALYPDEIKLRNHLSEIIKLTLFKS